MVVEGGLANPGPGSSDRRGGGSRGHGAGRGNGQYFPRGRARDSAIRGGRSARNWDPRTDILADQGVAPIDTGNRSNMTYNLQPNRQPSVSDWLISSQQSTAHLTVQLHKVIWLVQVRSPMTLSNDTLNAVPV